MSPCRSGESPPAGGRVTAARGAWWWAGSVAGGPHFLEELVGLADGGRGRVDVVAVRADGLGGGGHLVGGAVVGGELGVYLDLRVGGQGLVAGGVVQVVELGQVGGVHLVLDDEGVGIGGGRTGDVAADV